MNEGCERGTHNLRWIGEPEHDADTDTWWVETECRECGWRERADVTGTLPIAVHQAHLAWVDVFRSVAEAWRLDRFVVAASVIVVLAGVLWL